MDTPLHSFPRRAPSFPPARVAARLAAARGLRVGPLRSDHDPSLRASARAAFPGSPSPSAFAHDDPGPTAYPYLAAHGTVHAAAAWNRRDAVVAYALYQVRISGALHLIEFAATPALPADKVPGAGRVLLAWVAESLPRRPGRALTLNIVRPGDAAPGLVRYYQALGFNALPGALAQTEDREPSGPGNLAMVGSADLLVARVVAHAEAPTAGPDRPHGFLAPLPPGHAPPVKSRGENPPE